MTLDSRGREPTRLACSASTQGRWAVRITARSRSAARGRGARQLLHRDATVPTGVLDIGPPSLATGRCTDSTTAGSPVGHTAQVEDRRAEANDGLGVGGVSRPSGLSDGNVARGLAWPSEVILRIRSCSLRSASPSRGAARRRTVALVRVAPRRKGADQVLARDTARPNVRERPRSSGEAPLARRARLRGDETGDRPRPLRGSRLARISPPRTPSAAAHGFPALRRVLSPRSRTFLDPASSSPAVAANPARASRPWTLSNVSR